MFVIGSCDRWFPGYLRREYTERPDFEALAGEWMAE